MHNFSDKQHALRATKAFFRVYNKELSTEELFELQLGDRIASIEEITTAHRQHRAVEQHPLWAKIVRVQKILSYIPFIKAVFVCNTVALATADDSSDIDLFIICSKKRLFVARTVVTAILHVLRLRRHGDNIAGRCCLSFFISEEACSLAHIALKPQDIYLAFWMKTLTPIIAYDDILQTFLSENRSFLLDYFPSATCRRYKKAIQYRNIVVKCFEWMLSGPLGNGFDALLQRWQLARGRKKSLQLGKEASVIISPTMLKFHNIDRRKTIQKAFEEQLTLQQ